MSNATLSRTDADGREALAALAPARRDLYRFLSAAVLQPPTPEFLNGVREPQFQAALTELFSPAVVEPLQAFARQACEDPEAAQAARQEFLNLFKVPGGQYVPAYESVFRDTREINGEQVSGLLMGQSALDVQKWYHLAAVDISCDFKELPDHIGLEFHYLAYLCEKEQEFASQGDLAKQERAWEMQRDFLKAHIVSWIEPLVRRILEKTDHPLYRGVAELMREFTRCDLATLEAVLGPSEGKPVPAYAH